MRQSKRHGKEKEIGFRIPEDRVAACKKLIDDFLFKSLNGDIEKIVYVKKQAVLFEALCEGYKKLIFSDRKPGEPLKDYQKRTVRDCQAKANAVMTLEE